MDRLALLSAGLRGTLALALGTVILLLPALINGYPFVYSDTGTYILSAFTGYVPFDRPYWYGPFVRAASLGGLSLWGVAVVQSFLCAFYVLRVVRIVVAPTAALRTFLMVCVGLTLFSGISWYAARLIPDIFTGIGALAIFTLLHPRTSNTWRLVDLVVIIAACWFHSSNLPILTLAGALALLLLRVEQGAAGRLAWYAAVLLFAWGGAMVANFTLGGTAQVTRNSHVFLMGRMLDTGMLKAYLDEHCPTTDYGICAYRDKLPERSEHFLWHDDSPLSLQGGWDATQAEYGTIVKGSFSQFKYLIWHVRGSLHSTGEQLVLWDICRNMRSTWYRTETSPPRAMIAAHVPHELPRYLGALQNGGWGELDMRWPDRLYRTGLVFSLIMLLVGFNGYKRTDRLSDPQRFLLFAFITTLLAAWVCASLSVVDARYLARNSWLLPFAAMLMVRSVWRAFKPEASLAATA